MPNAVKWEAAPSASTVLSTELNSLGNDTMTAAGSEHDNSSNLNTQFWAELVVTFGSSPTDAVPVVDLYVTQAPDGTNYENAPVTGGADVGNRFVGAFPVRKVTSAQRVVIGPFLMAPHKLKFLADNQTGVAFPASGSTIKIFPNNFELQ